MNFRDLVTGTVAEWVSLRGPEAASADSGWTPSEAEDLKPAPQRGKRQTKPLEPLRIEFPVTTTSPPGFQSGTEQLGVTEADSMFHGGLKAEATETETSTSAVPQTTSPYSGFDSLLSTPTPSSPAFYYSDISPLASLFEPTVAPGVSLRASPASSDESSSFTIFVPVSLASPSSLDATAGASGQDSAAGPARRVRRSSRRRSQPYKLNDSLVFWEDAKRDVDIHDVDTHSRERTQGDAGPAPPAEATASTSDRTSNRSPEEGLTMKEKYIKIRALNNEASRRCRKRRLEKLKAMESEEKDLAQKNQEMKKTLNLLKKMRDKLSVAVGNIFKKTT